MTFDSIVAVLRRGVLAVALGVVAPLPALAQSYLATDLGQLDGKTTFGMGINASGQITGYSVGGGITQAFVSGANGQGLTALSIPGYEGYGTYARAINASGQVAGYVNLASGLT